MRDFVSTGHTSSAPETENELNGLAFRARLHALTVFRSNFACEGSRRFARDPEFRFDSGTA
jgi:hypothetical protein